MKAFAQIKQENEENLEYISQFMKENKKMTYVKYLAICSLPAIVYKINYLLKMPNITKEDFWVTKYNNNNKFQLAINAKKDI